VSRGTGGILTISSGLITPNWISRICLTGAEEYGKVTVIVAKVDLGIHTILSLS
jgi:hypothetical protein